MGNVEATEPGPNLDLPHRPPRALRRLLYGLHAILQLHFAQEDEGYLSLADDETPAAARRGMTKHDLPTEVRAG
jgi:hypothetical protein